MIDSRYSSISSPYHGNINYGGQLRRAPMIIKNVWMGAPKRDGGVSYGKISHFGFAVQDSTISTHDFLCKFLTYNISLGIRSFELPDVVKFLGSDLSGPVSTPRIPASEPQIVGGSYKKADIIEIPYYRL